MKRVRKLILGLLAIGLIGTGFAQGANAEWKQTNGHWNYIDASGSLKTGWFQDSGKCYYFNKSGNMMTGWIVDNGTWYYMLEDGSLDNSKTTTTMPNEIRLVYDIVKPLVKTGDLKYFGLAHIRQGGKLYHIQELQDKYLYSFITEENANNVTGLYLYDPTNGEVYQVSLDGTEVSLLGVGKTNYAINKPITKDEAVQNVKKYLTENNMYIPKQIEAVANSDEINMNNVYTVHCYNMTPERSMTYYWYYVDRSTGNVIKML